MIKEGVTVLHVEYPIFRDDSVDHIFMTALGTMWNDFNQTDKFHYMSPADYQNIIQSFSNIFEKLKEESELYDNTDSTAMIEMNRSIYIYPSLEKLFYETEYQVKISIAPLKVLSNSEKSSLDMLSHLQRFNKTTQQIREENIDKLIDN